MTPSARPLRVVFAGTPEFAATHLRAIIDSKHQLLAVYTQPDRPAGRGNRLQASPVKQLAGEAGVSVLQPPSLRDPQVQQALRALAADVMVVVAYGLILPQAALDAPTLGCLNVHASLLPRWRGAAPIQRAIEAGDRVSGITIMQMDAGLDTGDTLATAACEVGPRTTAADLYERLAGLGPPLLLQVLDELPTFQARAGKQDEARATYAGKILKTEAAIDWREDAVRLDRRIRAFNPAPVCFASIGGERVKVWQALPLPGSGPPGAPGQILRADRDGILVRCGSGRLLLQSLQLPGGKPLPAEQLLNARAARFAPGLQFDQPEPGSA